MEKKEEEEEGIVGRERRRRAFPKRHVSFNNYSIWKHKLREKCFKRVRNDRSRLLWKLRLPTTAHQFHPDSPQQQFINSTFQRIVSDELRTIIPPPLSAPLTHNHHHDDYDMLWEYDALHAACPDECEAILFEMQRIFYQDLSLELDQNHTTTEPESCINTWEDEEDEYLAHAVYEHMQLNEEQVQKKVWCPICKQGELQENCSHIYCSRCELKLNKEQEITLDLIRIRLAEAHSEHLDGGCRMKPRFCIQSRFNLTALYIECQGCSTFEVVI